MIRFVQALALAATLLLCAGHISFAQPAPAEIVKQRQDAMEKLWPDDYRDVSRTLKTDKPDLALVAAKSAQAIEALNRLAALFPPGTGRDVVPATRAKPEVWTQRAAFEAGAQGHGRHDQRAGRCRQERRCGEGQGAVAGGGQSVHRLPWRPQQERRQIPL